ncbi:guanylate cyclase [Pseudoscourfieldia marina]
MTPPYSCCSPSPRLQQPLPAAVSLPVVSSGGSESAANDPPPLTSAAASGGSGGGGGFLKYGVVFSHEKTYETYAEHAYELNKTALNAICFMHVIAVLTVLAAYANPQTHLPLRNLITGFCVHTILALAPLVMRVFYLNNKKAMQAYKLLAFVALLLPVYFARIHHDVEVFKSISPALCFIIHFGCYSMLLTDKFVAFLAEAGLVAVAVFAVESSHQHQAVHLIFDAFSMSTFIFLLYSWERTRRDSFLIEQRLAKQVADNKEADAAARQLNNRRILHDLKTPLAALLQLIKKLLTNPKDADMKLAFALTELIKHHVLALNHSEDAPKVVKDVTLKEHFTHMISLYAPLCEAVEQTLRLVCPLPMSVTAYVPVDLLDRAIANLISNATKFTTPGGSIVLDCSLTAGKLIVEVRDTGKGVAEEERDKIWLAGHQSQTDAVGLGLGLPSVKAFAEGEGGEVWCTANPAAEGEGAAIGFSICVPFDDEDSSIDKEEETVCVEIRNEEGARAKTPRVLLVEDDPVQLLALKRSVTKELPNADIETAKNGHEGLQRLRSSSFDAVLSDLLMPITDGATMLRQAESEGRLPSFARLLTYDTETASKLEDTSVPVQSKAPGIRAVVRETLLEWQPPSGDGATKEELAKKNALQCRVLLVEDDDLQLYDLRRRVQEELPNAIIETALNGREGLERLLTCDYDALITDLNMPVMDGVQMLNEARAKQCLPRVAKLNTATTRTPEFLSSCGLNAEDVFDKCETSRDVVKNVARQLVKREEFGSVDDVRIELGASSSDNSAKSLGSGSNNSSTKRLLSRVASTSSPKDVRDVAEILEDSTVLKGLKERHGALSDAITRGDAQSIKAIVHKLRGWAMSLQAHDLVSACAAYQDDPDRVEDVLSCLDGMAGPDVGDSAPTRRSFEGVSREALEKARRVAARGATRLMDVLRGSIPIEILQDMSAHDEPGSSVAPLHHDAVAIIFVDMVGSTRKFVENADFVEAMQRYFVALDRLAADCKVEKIRTIGDGYLATVGVIEDYHHRDNSQNLRDTKRRVLDAVEFAKQCVSMFNDQVRIGVHVGSCESCIVGMTSAQFDLFGSSVNFCARLEQACPRGCVHVSTDAMSFVLEEEQNGGGWEREVLELEYKGYDGAIRSTLLRPSMTTS